MKTVLIIVGGMADLPEDELNGQTPLMLAHTPSMDHLAQAGFTFSLPMRGYEKSVTTRSSVFQLLGYDMLKGLPTESELMEFGLEHSPEIEKIKNPYIILPEFSGHGEVLTTSPLVRGIGKLALLSAVDLYALGVKEENLMHQIARITVNRLPDQEFIMIYVDGPEKASMKGSWKEKIKSIEMIDRELVTPIADFAWHSDEIITIGVVSDHVSSWKWKRNFAGPTPGTIYVNDMDEKEDNIFDELAVQIQGYNANSSYEFIKMLIHFPFGYPG